MDMHWLENRFTFVNRLVRLLKNTFRAQSPPDALAPELRGTSAARRASAISAFRCHAAEAIDYSAINPPRALTRFSSSSRAI